SASDESPMLLRLLASVYEMLKSSPFDHRRRVLRMSASYWLMPRLIDGRRLVLFGDSARSARRKGPPFGRVLSWGRMFSFRPSISTKPALTIFVQLISCHL